MLVKSSAAVITAREGISQLGPQLGEFFSSLPGGPSDTPREPPEQRGRGSPAAKGGDPRTFLPRSPGPQRSAARRGGGPGAAQPPPPPGSAARLGALAESSGRGRVQRDGAR